MMPKAWELPSEAFFGDVNLPTSPNPTINFLDVLVRKNKLLHEQFRGKNQPSYMKSGNLKKDQAKPDLPSINKKKKQKKVKQIPIRLNELDFAEI